jgi:hypothetical protein
MAVNCFSPLGDDGADLGGADVEPDDEILCTRALDGYRPP